MENDAPLAGVSDWLQEALVETEIVLLVPAGHRWLQDQKPVPLGALAEESLVWREEGSGIRERALQALKAEGFYPGYSL